MPYVETYSYYIGNDEPEPIYNMENYEGGFIVVDIDLTDYPTTGVITLVGSNEDGKSAILADHEYSLLTPGELPPDVYVSARYSDSVKFVVNSNDPDAVYVIDIEDSNGDSKQEVLKATDGTLVVSELSEDLSYTFKITLLNASATTTLKVGTYQYNMVMNLSVTDEGFVITEIPDGVADITLKKRDDSAFEISHSVSDSSVTILYSEMKSLESGDFYVIGNDGSETCYSNIIQTVTPLVIIGKRENYRSVDLYVDLANETLTTDNIYITGVQNVSRSLEYGEEYDVITVSNLSSNHEHSFTIRVSTDDYTQKKDVTDIKTKSFAGLYFEWTGELKPPFFGSTKKANFSVYVDNAHEGSDYPYYVYFSKNDDVLDGNASGYEKSDLRITPLVDSSLSVGEPKVTEDNYVITFKDSDQKIESGMTTQGDDLKTNNHTYLVNSGKWNSMGVNPDWWYIIYDESSASDDNIITKTMSQALGMDADTTTAFYFSEVRNEDGSVSPFIKFYNYGDIAKMGLYKNASQEWQQFESVKPEKPEYTYYLSLVDFSEGDAE